MWLIMFRTLLALLSSTFPSEFLMLMTTVVSPAISANLTGLEISLQLIH